MAVDYTYHGEETIQKVFGALIKDGILTGDQAQDAMVRILNAGILFREPLQARGMEIKSQVIEERMW